MEGLFSSELQLPAQHEPISMDVFAELQKDRAGLREELRGLREDDGSALRDRKEARHGRSHHPSDDQRRDAAGQVSEGHVRIARQHEAPDAGVVVGHPAGLGYFARRDPDGPVRSRQGQISVLHPRWCAPPVEPHLLGVPVRGHRKESFPGFQALVCQRDILQGLGMI